MSHIQHNGEIFTGPGVLKMIGAPGRDIERPTLDRWRVFIQSMNGNRYIHGGSLLLYEVNLMLINATKYYATMVKHCYLQDLGSDTDNLEPVDSGRLEILDVKETCSLRDFVEKTHQLVPYNPRRFFFEFVGAKENITDDKEIILMDKVGS